MAVTRPLKEGSVTTYQQKVALGFPDILASEMDADLDTIYAAWNGNVGTANLVDGSVTYAKLAPDAQLWRDTGSTLVPGTSFATRPVAVPGDASMATLLLGNASVKARLQEANSGVLGAGLFVNRNFASANAQDDATKPSWGCFLSAGNDQFLLQHSPAGSTAQTNLLTLDATGNLSVVGSANMSADITLNANNAATGGKGSVAHVGSTGVYLAVNDRWAPAAPSLASWNFELDTAGSVVLVHRAPGGGAGSADHIITFSNAGNFTIDGAVATKASGTTWANPSDPRLKEDVAPYAAGLAEILRLEPITYHLKAQPDGPLCYGFDASAVREVLPECVSTTKMKLDPADEEETEDVLTFDMHPILVALINAIRDLNAKVSG